MSNVLITFIGTGTDNRDYKSLYYKFKDDSTRYQSKYFFEPIVQKEKIDKLVLLGTHGSIWETLYNKYSDADNRSEVFKNIEKHCKGNVLELLKKSPSDFPFAKEIEVCIKKHFKLSECKVQIIRYGKDEDDIKENSNLIITMMKDLRLSSSDKLFFDITHSFRSLPLYLMNCFIYMKSIQNIGVESIYYAMEAANGLEKGEDESGLPIDFTPVVDLKEILKINDWIVGAYAFKEFGNAYKIAELMGGNDELNKFSNLINLNNLLGIQNNIETFSNLKGIDDISSMIIEDVANDFRNNFDGICDKNGNQILGLFQYKLACWQALQRNYGLAYLTLSESIVSYQGQKDLETLADQQFEDRYSIKKRNFDYKEKTSRDAIKEYLSNKFHDTLSDEYLTFKKGYKVCNYDKYYQERYSQNGKHKVEEIYCIVNNYRNSIAHSVNLQNSEDDALIKTLNDAIKDLNNYFRLSFEVSQDEGDEAKFEKKTPIGPKIIGKIDLSIYNKKK